MSDASESVEVSCPRCECRFRPAVRMTPYFARCPDCAEPVRVPAAAEVEDEMERERAEAGDAGTYRLALPAGWDPTPSEPEASPPPSAATPLSPKRPRPSDDSASAKSSRSSQGEQAEDAGGTSPAASDSGVTCLACGASFEAARSEMPQTVLCPECLEDVSIPAALAPPPAAESKPPKNSQEPKPRESQRAEEDEKTWGSSLTEPAEGAEDVPKKKKRKRRKPAAADAMPMPAENPTRRGKPAKSVQDALAEVRQVEEEPPPEWLFFSGVFGFLLRPAVLIRWIYATVGFCVMGVVWAFWFYIYRQGLILPLPFLGLLGVLITVACLAYAAACSLPVLLETSAGNNKIDDWPEPDVREQAVDLVYLGYLLIIAEVLSALAGQVLSLFFGSVWLPSMICGFLLYPVVLLSSLEAGTPFMPFTWPIVKSLKTLTWAWGVFYGLAAGLTAVWLLPLFWEFGDAPVSHGDLRRPADGRLVLFVRPLVGPARLADLAGL